MGYKAKELRIKGFFSPNFLFMTFFKSLEENGSKGCPGFHVIWITQQEAELNCCGETTLFLGTCYFIDLRPHLNPPNMCVSDLGKDINSYPSRFGFILIFSIVI